MLSEVQISPMRKWFALSFFLLLSTLLLAEGTRTWEQSRFDDFEKGTAKGVAIRSDGTLELAPSFKAIYTTPSTYIWSIVTDNAGNVYAATGAPARVYRLTPDGQASIIFAPQELQVQALAMDKSGAIYAATSPDGKVYRLEQQKPRTKKSKDKEEDTAEQSVAPAPEKNRPTDRSQIATDPSWTSSLFFDPGTKYIWDLALDREGNLYVATGDHGEIFRVTPTGQHALFFKSDEAHIRVLALDTLGNLIAGSDGSGLVYRISPAGEAFVLYSAPKKEITALAIDPAGNIYAAGIGEKRGQPVPAPAQPAPSGNPPAAGTGSNTPALPAITVGGSEVYRIAPDGSPRRLWSSRDDLVYALGFDQAGRLLAGTGNKGRIFAIAGEDNFTDLLKASATQVTAFARSPRGGLYAATSNLGKVFFLGPTPDSEGSFESDVFDAHIFSRWGRAEVRYAGNLDLFARSGNVDNPDRNWSPWRQVDLVKDIPIDAPPGRFIQWKAVLKAGNPLAQLESVLLNYRSKNVAPEIDEVQVLPGIRYQPAPKITADNSGGGIGAAPQAPPGIRDRDSIGVRWNAHDDNDDQLVFSVYYRSDNDHRWLLLRDSLTDRVFSFDAGLLPDGGYTIKVVASDAPSHSPDEVLSAERESSRFEVDTTPPRVDYLNAAYDVGQLHITFRGVDGFSPIRRAEYSVDAGDWQFIEPVDQISDSRVENYDVTVRLPGMTPQETVVAAAEASGRKAKRKKDGADLADPPIIPAQSGQEHVIVVRVYDRFDNMGTAKAIVRGQ